MQQKAKTLLFSKMDTSLNTTTECNTSIESASYDGSLRRETTNKCPAKPMIRTGSGTGKVFVAAKWNFSTGSHMNVQSKPDLPVQSRWKISKRRVDMERLERLAKPRPHSMARPPSHRTSKTAKKKGTTATVHGPPLSLSRNVPACTAKSTTELEAEEMDSFKPFKARRILGSSHDPKSKYKTKPSHPSTQAASLATVITSEHKPSTAKSWESSRLYNPPPIRKRVWTRGENIEYYLNHGLRGNIPITTRPSKRVKLTPNSPSNLSSQTQSRSTAKSSEDIELEECMKQFQAMPIGHGRTSSTHQKS
mmetsp:Transcript_9069/g.19161  ORF Transcript_9069/g.19161 Transcript_9069/m.19161 type:complete len:307 (-) Transcript_9069:70-990(-)